MERKPTTLTLLRACHAGLLVTVVIFLATLPVQIAHGATAQAIGNRADAVLERLFREVAGSREFVEDAVGILVFPQVVRRGFGVVGAYGEGVLRIAGEAAAHYQLTAESTDFPFSAQAKSVILVFHDSRVLQDFHSDEAQRLAIDAPITVAAPDDGLPADSGPVTGFVLGNRGLMDIPTLNGLRYRKLPR